MPAVLVTGYGAHCYSELAVSSPVVTETITRLVVVPTHRASVKIV